MKRHGNHTSSIQWINFTTFTLNAVNEWFIDYISLTSLHFGKSTHSIRIHTAQAKRSELLGLYWVIAFIVVSLYRFTLVRFLQLYQLNSSFTHSFVHSLPFLCFHLQFILHWRSIKVHTVHYTHYFNGLCSDCHLTPVMLLYHSCC